MQASDFLKAGIKHMEDRAATYDKPEGERSMSATVAAFNAVTGDGVMNTEERGWLFMQLLKAVRSQQGEFRADSYEDGASYSGLAGEAAYKERGPGKKKENWPASADERMLPIMQNGNDGEHYGDEMQLGHMLTKHALLRGGWWCADTSEPARQAFALRGFNVADQWELEGLDGCRLTGGENVTRFNGMSKTKGLREITLIDGDFYYCKSQSLNEGEHYEDGLVWIEYDGTECPVGTESTVVVRLRCGVVNDPCLARLYNWRSVSDDYPFDITHYRIVEQSE